MTKTLGAALVARLLVGSPEWAPSSVITMTGLTIGRAYHARGERQGLRQRTCPSVPTANGLAQPLAVLA